MVGGVKSGLSQRICETHAVGCEVTSSARCKGWFRVQSYQSSYFQEGQSWTSFPSVLSDRVERLERQNRRLKRLGLSGIACLIVVTIIGGAKLARNADSIGAKAFVLFDDKDRARAVMTVDPDEGPGISFFHADESRRIDVRIDNKGSPRVNLYGKEDKEGAARVELDIKEGTPRMTFTRDDRNKTPQMAASFCLAVEHAGTSLTRRETSGRACP